MANSDQKARDTLAADETDELISSEKVEGTAVYDRKGEKIGSVHHLMINKYTGQVAMLSSRLAARHRRRVSPIPWRLLDYDEQVGGYVVDIDREQLEKAPRFAESREPDWEDRDYTARIDEYWMILPKRIRGHRIRAAARSCRRCFPSLAVGRSDPTPPPAERRERGLNWHAITPKGIRRACPRPEILDRSLLLNADSRSLRCRNAFADNGRRGMGASLPSRRDRAFVTHCLRHRDSLHVRLEARILGRN